MLMFRFAALFLAILFTLVPSASGQLFKDAMFEVQIQKDIVYATGSTGNPASGEINLALDLFTPVGAEFTKPGMFLLYGGGFEERNLGQLDFLAQEFASRGWIVATGDYRIVSDDPTKEDGLLGPPSDPLSTAITAAVNDAAKGVNWLKENAEQLGIDTERIVSGGASSGAITSLIEGYGNNSVAGIISLCGGMFGYENLMDAGDPPVVLAHNTVDDLVAYSLAEAVVARAEQVGVANALLTFDEAGHCSFLIDPVQRPQTITFVNDFLYDQLDLASVPEPSSASLLCLGIFALIGRTRRFASGK